MDSEERASPVATGEGDLEMKFVLEDCRRALASIVHEEKLLEKKRRWLMASHMKARSTHKRLRTSRFFRNMYLPESFVRSDDAGLQNIRMLVQTGFRLSAENKKFNLTHPDMGEIIEESSPESFAQSQPGDHFEGVNMLSQILSHLTNLTPTSSSFVKSMSKILEGLEVLPSLALIAMKRKLKDVTVTPQFPVVFSCNRSNLIGRLRNRCHKILSTLKEGGQLPKPLAKAFSVMFLSIKQTTRQADIVATKFFLFTPEIENLQNEILKAIWLLPNVKHGELKHLQHVIAPNANLPSKSLRRAFHNYLMEYLFHCDEVDVSKSLLMALELIGKGSGCQLLGEEVSEEVEAILNVSSQLGQVVWDSFPDESMEQEFAHAYPRGLGANEDDCDIVIDENEDCSTFGYSDYLQICESDDEVEGTGDSMLNVSNLNFKCKGRSSSQLNELIEEKQASCISLDEPPGNQNGSLADASCHPANSNMTNRYLALKNICDGTSLVAYKLIGLLLEKLVQDKGKRVDEAMKLYLRGVASSSPNCQDPGQPSVLSDNLESAILQVIGETTLSFPNSGVERVKQLTRLL